MLVPSDKERREFVEKIPEHLGFKTFDASSIEDSKKPFTSEDKAVAVIANRYDGIDFPGKECRLLFVQGLPKAMNLQERFFMSRMGANILFNERVQTRILQAIGRCTRSLEDRSAVVVEGEELTGYLADIKRRKYFHPELQSEISFGIDQSTGTTMTDLLENFDIFLKNKREWEEVNQIIVDERHNMTQSQLPAIDELSAVVGHEVDFQKQLWQGDHEAAYGSAERVLGKLSSSELRGYRALWHYLAGSAAWMGAKSEPAFDQKARSQFANAKEAAPGIPWLVSLSSRKKDVPEKISDRAVLFGQIERFEAQLAKLGTTHDRAFARLEKDILEGLQSSENGPFERAHVLLGQILGFDAGNEETEGSPDPWWIAGTVALVFEDHSGALSTSALDVRKARQAFTHPNWLRSNVPEASNSEIISVLVSPVSTAKQGAQPHLDNVFLWRLSEFRTWAQAALSTVRELRITFTEQGDLDWRNRAAEVFEQRGLDAPGLIAKLKKQPAASLLVPVP